MSIEHTNRADKVYYLHVGVRKNGKPNYFFSQEPDGALVDKIPAGFEVFENVQGQVFLRRKQPRTIADEEINLVAKALTRLKESWRYKAEAKKDAIVIFEAPENDSGGWSELMPWASVERLRDYAIKHAYYQAVMRFVLADKEKRLFVAVSFCFRGSVDDWIDIRSGLKPLPALLKEYFKYLGTEDIYELF